MVMARAMRARSRKRLYAAFKIKQVLLPPNPNEFDAVTRTRCDSA